MARLWPALWALPAPSSARSSGTAPPAASRRPATRRRSSWSRPRCRARRRSCGRHRLRWPRPRWQCAQPCPRCSPRRQKRRRRACRARAATTRAGTASTTSRPRGSSCAAALARRRVGVCWPAARRQIRTGWQIGRQGRAAGPPRRRAAWMEILGVEVHARPERRLGSCILPALQAVRGCCRRQYVRLSHPKVGSSFSHW